MMGVIVARGPGSVMTNKIPQITMYLLMNLIAHRARMDMEMLSRPVAASATSNILVFYSTEPLVACWNGAA